MPSSSIRLACSIGVDPAQDRSLDPAGAVRVRRHLAARRVRLVDEGLDFLQRQLLRAGRVALGRTPRRWRRT